VTDRPTSRKTALLTITAALLFSATLPFAATKAQADFYRYVGKDGVEVYTNIPTSDDAVRILREREERETERAKAETKKERKAAAKAQRSQQAQQPPEVSQTPFATSEPQLPVYGVVTSRVGWRHDPIDGTTRHHNGVDIGIPTGTAVKAVAGGRVLESGWHGGYGNLVTIDHGDGSFSMYGHNSQLAVRAGDLVQAGQTIALSGSTGRSTGPHLHFEFWRNGSNVTEDYLSQAAVVSEVTAAVKRSLQTNGAVVSSQKY
jgi:murein DD-endopeptidase MepM/ murein hydrolase activator NlpD